MTLASWKHGKCLAWDFTCVDTMADSHINLTTQGPGKAAEKAEKGKLAKYADLTHNFIVQPVAVETLGAWGPSSIKFLEEIGSRIATATGEKRSTSYLFQALSMAIQRGNVTSIRGSIPKSQRHNEIFYL